ncbi:MAG: ThiF family adenylyltransferase [Chloroflexi bacterium]|nr:ThiF family adenylyltransferase [Chloroflexota bacterium]
MEKELAGAGIERYSRQIIFPGIGRNGQAKLSKSQAVIIGCGALGSVIATTLVRAGIGKVKIVDRDFIEHHNLQRQVLFDEDDVVNALPKAIAAERHLRRINSSVEVEGIVTDVNFTNIEKIVSGADVILDGLDNFETRFLLNDACLKHGVPWVYGGAIAASGMTMNIFPGKPPCFRCFAASPPGCGMLPTCDTVGVIGPAPYVIGSLQAAEALKILVGSTSVNRGLTLVDVWNGTFKSIEIKVRSGCPACEGKYDFLESKFGLKAAALCGQNAVQVLSTKAGVISFDDLEARLKAVGAEVTTNDFMLRFSLDSHDMVVFSDGRAILRNSTDESLAKGLYNKYIGT